MKVIHNSFPIIREAKVINTTDPEELGRIQLKVYPELSEIPDGDCPWCFPHSASVHGKSFGLPLVDQLISCVVWNRYWNEISFLPFNISKPTEHLFNDFIENIRPLLKDVPINSEEEHLVVERYEDDFSVYHDTKNKQHGIVHPSGAHFTINNLGDIFLWLIKLLTVHNGDDSLILEIDPETKNVKFYQKGKFESETEDIADIKVHKNVNVEIGENLTSKIDGDQTKEIGGDENRYVEGSRTTNINTDEDLSIAGNCTWNIGGTLDLKVGGAVTINGSVIKLN